MRVLIGSNNCKPSKEHLDDALGKYGDDTTFMCISVHPADDEVAEYAFRRGLRLEHISPDTGLRGNGANIYAFKTLARTADEIVIFFKKHDKDVKEMLAVANELDIKFSEYYFS